MYGRNEPAYVRRKACGCAAQRSEIPAAMSAAAAAAGLDFLSGRVPALFYAQTGEAAWQGILISGFMFGLLNWGLGHLKRRSCARNLDQLLHRLPGGAAGMGIRLLRDLILLAAAYMLASVAGHAGALMLPVRGARAWASAAALLAAAVLAGAGGAAMWAWGAVFAAASMMFLASLLVWGRLPPEMGMYRALELRLEGSFSAALLFALAHSCLCMCMTAGMTVKTVGMRVRPGRLGFWSGLFFAALLFAGNAVFARGEEVLPALGFPFAALAGGWGSAGFYITAALIFASSVYALACIFHGRFSFGREHFLFRKMMLNYENSHEFN